MLVGWEIVCFSGRKSCKDGSKELVGLSGLTEWQPHKNAIAGPCNDFRDAVEERDVLELSGIGPPDLIDGGSHLVTDFRRNGEDLTRQLGLDDVCSRIRDGRGCLCIKPGDETYRNAQSDP